MSFNFRSGFYSCDVCGESCIFTSMVKGTIRTFEISGIEGPLHCCMSCESPLEKAAAKTDYTLLPEGPLRRVFVEHNREDNR